MAELGNLQNEIRLLAQQFGTEGLLRRDLGERSFVSIADVIAWSVDLLRQLSETGLGSLPQKHLDALENAIVSMRNWFGDLVGFGSSTPATIERRDELARGFREAADRWFDELLLPIAFFRSTNLSLQNERNQATALIGSIQQIQRQADETLKEQRRQGEEIVAALRDTAGATGVSESAAFFLNESTAYASASRWWLLATLLITISIIGLAWYSYKSLVPSLTATEWPQAIQLAVAKIAIFTVSYYVLLLCARNFSASRHNFSINKRKATALRTFRAFVQTTSDPATKDAVLRVVTESIFGSDASGYLAREPEAKLGNTSILEILRPPESHH